MSSKINYLIKITCLFWIITKILSYKLWLSNRLFPLVPPFDFLENIPNWIHLTLFFCGLLLLVLTFIAPKNKFFIALTIGVELGSCLLDQNRWQPYEYHCILLFSFYYFFGESKKFINYFVFLLIAIYINSGLHKLNGGFLVYVWERMILIRFFGLEPSEIKNVFLHYSGLTLGLLEFGAGFGLLFLKHKRLYAALLIAMHLFILVLLSPLGLNYNSIVWPWNIVIIVFLLMLYFDKKYPIPTIQLKELILGKQFVFFILIGILPLLNFFGYYDKFLSFNLYSGKDIRFIIHPKEEQTINKYKAFISLDSNDKAIRINKWSLLEMNTIAYPEKRVYLKIIERWKQENPNSKDEFFLIDFPYAPSNKRQIE
jgi:hypothetical protein